MYAGLYRSKKYSAKKIIIATGSRPRIPIMDGIEATINIRKKYKSSELPIVAMTADAMYGVRDSVLKAGMNDYISKPFNVDEVFKKIRSYAQMNVT